jgi:uncharacterized membrane protein
MEINQKKLGLVLIVFSLILLAVLIGVKLDADKQSRFLCDNFHNIQSTVGTCPAHTSNTSWLLILGLGVDVAIFLAGVYLTMTASKVTQGKEKNKEKRISSKPISSFNPSELDEDEKHIYSLVVSKGGSSFQGDLVRKSGFSKVKISRILDRLEARNAIERHRRGMANLIVKK